MARVWLRVTAEYSDRDAEVREFERSGVDINTAPIDVAVPKTLGRDLKALGDLQRVTYEITARSVNEAD